MEIRVINLKIHIWVFVLSIALATAAFIVTVDVIANILPGHRLLLTLCATFLFFCALYYLGVKFNLKITSPMNKWQTKAEVALENGEPFNFAVSSKAPLEISQFIEDVQNVIQKINKKMCERTEKLSDSLVEQFGIQSELEMSKVKLEENNLELKEIVQSLEVAMKRAKDATKAKSDFLANMSHELRTPMNGILGFSELLLGSELKGDQVDNIKMIHRSGTALLSILNDILDYSKIEAGQMKIEEVNFDLREVCTDVCEMLKTKVKPGVKFYAEIDDRVPRFGIGDPFRIRQVLINLVGNSAKFTTRGEIKIGLALIRNDDDEMILSYSVTDTGIGIPKNKQAAIFEEFQQADDSTTRQYGGTGLGLAISRRIVDLMFGQFTLESDEGKGSCFKFSLRVPVVTDAQVEAEQAAAEKMVGNLDEIEIDESFEANILVVEDNKVNQKLITRVIEKLGHKVTLSDNGYGGLEKVFEDEFDLVFMDMQMPVMNGLEATEAIREAGKAVLPIVAVTANAFESDQHACFEAGMNDFISKPVKAKEIQMAIAKWVVAARATK